MIITIIMSFVTGVLMFLTVCVATKGGTISPDSFQWVFSLLIGFLSFMLGMLAIPLALVLSGRKLW